VTTVYCDESGYSGPNLYHDAVPYFVYSSVAIEPGKAQAVVDRIKGFYGRFQGEVKFATLVKKEEGRAALTWLLDEHRSRARVWFADKKFAAAGKFFEYVFEPVLSDNSLLFYRHDFHRFIANLLYLGVVAKDEQADQLLADCQKLIRERDCTGLKRLLGDAAEAAEEGCSAYDDIAAFAVGYREAILDEVNTLDAWAMDLTLTAFTMVSRAQAERHPAMTVVCDESKPLKLTIEHATRVIQADLSTVTTRLGWPVYAPVLLREPITITKASNSTPGIQIADLFAGMTRMALAEPNEPICQAWREKVLEMVLPSSVGPEDDYIDLDRPMPRVNACVLRELARRARAGLDPLAGMGRFYAVAKSFERVT
jgi:hypothetical protein